MACRLPRSVLLLLMFLVASSIGFALPARASCVYADVHNSDPPMGAQVCTP